MKKYTFEDARKTKKLLDSGRCVVRGKCGKKKYVDLEANWKIGLPDDDQILSHEEVKVLFDNIDEGDFRNKILFGLVFRTGARASQNLAVKVCDINFINKRVFIKAAKEGISFYRYLDDAFLRDLREYIRHYNLKDGDYLFSIYYKRNNYNDWYKKNIPIHRRTLAFWLDKYARKAGLQYYWIDRFGMRRRRVHPHTIKYTIASWIYAECRDVLATALAVGNRTTAIMEKHYIKVPTSYRKDVVERALTPLANMGYVGDDADLRDKITIKRLK